VALAGAAGAATGATLAGSAPFVAAGAVVAGAAFAGAASFYSSNSLLIISLTPSYMS